MNITKEKRKMSRERALITDRDWQTLEHTVLVRHRLEEQYQDLDQQTDASVLGMWLFLATEIMFFGTLFTAFGVYYYLYAAAFEHASGRLNWQIGSLNTIVLLISSFTMALSVYYARLGRSRHTVSCLLLTAALGTCFLALKGYEYYEDFQHGLVLGHRFDPSAWISAGLSAAQVQHVKLFLLLYWIMTIGHAIHMIIGISAVLIIAYLASKNRFDANYYAPVDVTGLYWHFVDIVWIFLFPALYLLSTHHT
jgi:cytochrome c oxidase subunit III